MLDSEYKRRYGQGRRTMSKAANNPIDRALRKLAADASEATTPQAKETAAKLPQPDAAPASATAQTQGQPASTPTPSSHQDELRRVRAQAQSRRDSQRILQRNQQRESALATGRAGRNRLHRQNLGTLEMRGAQNDPGATRALINQRARALGVPEMRTPQQMSAVHRRTSVGDPTGLRGRMDRLALNRRGKGRGIVSSRRPDPVQDAMSADTERLTGKKRIRSEKGQSRAGTEAGKRDIATGRARLKEKGYVPGATLPSGTRVEQGSRGAGSVRLVGKPREVNPDQTRTDIASAEAANDRTAGKMNQARGNRRNVLARRMRNRSARIAKMKAKVASDQGLIDRALRSLDKQAGRSILETLLPMPRTTAGTLAGGLLGAYGPMAFGERPSIAYGLGGGLAGLGAGAYLDYRAASGKGKREKKELEEKELHEELSEQEQRNLAVLQDLAEKEKRSDVVSFVSGETAKGLKGFSDLIDTAMQRVEKRAFWPRKKKLPDFNSLFEQANPSGYDAEGYDLNLQDDEGRTREFNDLYKELSVHPSWAKDTARISYLPDTGGYEGDRLEREVMEAYLAERARGTDPARLAALAKLMGSEDMNPDLMDWWSMGDEDIGRYHEAMQWAGGDEDYYWNNPANFPEESDDYAMAVASGDPRNPVEKKAVADPINTAMQRLARQRGARKQSGIVSFVSGETSKGLKGFSDLIEDELDDDEKRRKKEKKDKKSLEKAVARNKRYRKARRIAKDERWMENYEDKVKISSLLGNAEEAVPSPPSAFGQWIAGQLVASEKAANLNAAQPGVPAAPSSHVTSRAANPEQALAQTIGAETAMKTQASRKLPKAPVLLPKNPPKVQSRVRPHVPSRFNVGGSLGASAGTKLAGDRLDAARERVRRAEQEVRKARQAIDPSTGRMDLPVRTRPTTPGWVPPRHDGRPTGLSAMSGPAGKPHLRSLSDFVRDIVTGGRHFKQKTRARKLETQEKADKARRAAKAPKKSPRRHLRSPATPVRPKRSPVPPVRPQYIAGGKPVIKVLPSPSGPGRSYRGAPAGTGHVDAPASRFDAWQEAGVPAGAMELVKLNKFDKSALSPGAKALTFGAPATLYAGWAGGSLGHSIGKRYTGRPALAGTIGALATGIPTAMLSHEAYRAMKDKEEREKVDADLMEALHEEEEEEKIVKKSSDLISFALMKISESVEDKKKKKKKWKNAPRSVTKVKKGIGPRSSHIKHIARPGVKLAK